METRLQSNEVRIPKKMDNINLSNSAIMVFSGGDQLNDDKMFKCENNKKIEFSTIQQQCNNNINCSPYFQSSYARSLSTYGHQQQSQSLDFELNFQIGGGDDDDNDFNDLNDAGGGDSVDYDKNGITESTSSSPVPPPLPATAPPSLLRQFSENVDDDDLSKPLLLIVNSTKSLPPPPTAVTAVTGAPVSFVPSTVTASTTTATTKRANLITPSTTAPIITTSKRRNTINNINIFQQDNNTKLVSTDCEVLRLRKECQSLIEDNRRLISVTGRNSFGGSDNGISNSNGGLRNGNYQNQRNYHQFHLSSGGGNDHHGNLTNNGLINNIGNSSNVETVVLQTQVNTLQWQLKQVESSRQMYHAVMEEVVRFLERCHTSLNEIEASQQQISRSKSVSHVYHQDASILSTGNEDLIVSGGGGGGIGGNNSTAAGGGKTQRQRTSTKIMEKQHLDSSTNSFGNFKDFTWRRSPKYTDQLLRDHLKTEPHKLAQEAFRLFRTAQNLLNLKEPTLAEVQPPSKESIYQSMVSSSNAISHHSNQQHQQHHQQHLPHLPHQQQQQQQQYHQSHLHLRCSTPTFPSVMMINRNVNSRESRLSIQSSTDDSVHSTASSTTSSSRPETDEDIITHGGGISSVNIHQPSFNQKISNHNQHQHQHQNQHHHHHHENSSLTPPSSTSSSPTAKTRTIKTTSSTNKIISTNNNNHNLIDDESGFSSMNSFQEIGIPISSSSASSASSSSSTSSKVSSLKPIKPILPHRATISQINNKNNINSTGNSNDDDDDDDDDDIDAGIIVNDHHLNDEEELLKNSTIKLRPFLSAAVRTLPVCHRRWSSAPPIPPKRNLSAFNADGGVGGGVGGGGASEPLKVLWV